MRSRIAILILFAAVLTGSGLTRVWGAKKTPTAGGASDGLDDPEVPIQRIREGTRLVAQSGRFAAIGDRIVFVSDRDQVRLVVLENLALERVSRMLGEGRGPAAWSVHGTITEFHGENFLLLERAVRKGVAPAAGRAL